MVGDKGVGEALASRGTPKNLTSLFLSFFLFDWGVIITLDCDEHFVCYWRILWKLLSGKLDFFSAFYTAQDSLGPFGP